MLQHKLIDDYAAKALPRQLPKKQYRLLKDELVCHILDKAEFYIEIGYDEETAVRRTLEEMGDAKEVFAGIKTVYKTKPEIFLVLSGTLALLTVLLYSVLSCLPVDMYDFEAYFILLVCTRLSLVLCLLYAVCTVLVYKKAEKDKKIRHCASELSVFAVFSCCVYIFFGTFDYYFADNYFTPEEVSTESVQGFFPYSVLSRENADYYSFEIGENYLADYMYAEYSDYAGSFAGPRYFSAVYYRSGSPFFKKRMIYENLYIEKIFYKRTSWLDNSSKMKLDGVSYMLCGEEDCYGILIEGAFDAYFIKIDTPDETVTEEAFAKTAVEQYILIKKTFREGRFDSLTLKEKYDRFYY